MMHVRHVVVAVWCSVWSCDRCRLFQWRPGEVFSAYDASTLRERMTCMAYCHVVAFVRISFRTNRQCRPWKYYNQLYNFGRLQKYFTTYRNKRERTFAALSCWKYIVTITHNSLLTDFDLVGYIKCSDEQINILSL